MQFLEIFNIFLLTNFMILGKIVKYYAIFVILDSAKVP